MHTALTVLAVVYAVAWFLFWLSELPHTWQLAQTAPVDPEEAAPSDRWRIFAMYAAFDVLFAFFWPIILARGPAYVLRAAPQPKEDEDCE
jgi:hypothetical protein